MDDLIPSRSGRLLSGRIFFTRAEFAEILALYGRMVASGEWRDYGIDALPDCCVFSVFRRTSEAPLYRIEKRPALARKQGAFTAYDSSGRALKRGHELGNVLRFFDKARLRLVGN